MKFDLTCRYVALEEFDNGIKSYQSALRIDSRHYKSLYGLGMVYLRQEKFEFAEHHFRMAFRINPCSSIIMSYLGTALHALKVNHDFFYRFCNFAVLFYYLWILLAVQTACTSCCHND